MNILLINTLYYPEHIGGAELSVQALAEGLSQNHNVIVLTLNELKDKIYTLNGVKIYSLKIRNKYWPYDKNKSISKWQKLAWHYNDIDNHLYDKVLTNTLADEKPDLIHTHNLSGFSPRIFSLFKTIPLVHTLRDYYLMCPSSTMYKNDKKCGGLCRSCRVFSKPKRGLSKSVNYVVGISDYILQKHKDFGYFEGLPSSVVYNGIDSNRSLRVELLQKRELHTFGFIGRLSHEKGVDLLLESFKLLQQHINVIKLVIAGSGDLEYVNYLKEKAGDNVLFLGHVDSVDFYKKVDVVVVPSLWEEPFGRVVVEAQLNNCLVLGARNGGIIELLDNQYLFDDNIESLYNKLEETVKKQITEQSAKAITSVVEMVQKYEMIYRSLLND